MSPQCDGEVFESHEVLHEVVSAGASRQLRIHLPSAIGLTIHILPNPCNYLWCRVLRTAKGQNDILPDFIIDFAQPTVQVQVPRQVLYKQRRLRSY